MTVTRYRKQILSVPRILCPIIGTDVGINLALQGHGATGLVIDGTSVYFYKQAQLIANMELRDNSTNPLIAGDNSGNIDQLARVDDALKTPSDSHEVVCTPSELINASQSGTIDEEDGSWTVTADDELYMFLGRVLDFKNVNGTVRIDSIVIHFNTSHNDCHILSTYVHLINRDSGGKSVAIEDLVEHGEGGTGNDNGEVECNLTLVTNNAYRLLINVEATAGTMIIRAVTFKYHIV